MTGPDEPTRPDHARGAPPDETAEPTEHLDLREEWSAPADTAPGRGDQDLSDTAAHEMGGVRTRPAARVDELPKKKVVGIARGVNIRTDQQKREKLTFRVDRYDAGGNRLSPVAVEMKRYRGGLVTDGDEVEVVGKWSRGTLRATRIRNLTSASDVRGWFAGWGKWVLIAIGVIVVAAIAVAVTAMATNSSSGIGGGLKVPDVVGQDEASALSTLRDAGLSPTSTREPSDSVSEGEVIRTEPPADFPIGTGDKVTVVVSSGAASTGQSESNTPAPPQQQPPPEETVPPTDPETTTTVQTEVISDEVGANADAAKVQLESLGFEVELVREASGDVPRDIVIHMDPAANTAAPVGTKVTLYESTGSAFVFK